MVWNGPSQFWPEEVAWNVGSQLWPDCNGLEWKKSVLA
jgi:hypothetical protein